MTRVTRKRIRDKVQFLSEHYRLGMSVEWGYGQARIYTAGGARELSPRLSTGQMLDWLEAFQTGLKMGYETCKQEGEKLGLKF